MNIRLSRFVLIVLAVVVVNVLLIFTVSGIGTVYPEVSLSSNVQLMEGDLVFRSGNGIISDWFRRCCLEDPSFSHAGILIKKDNADFVVHLQQTSSDGSLKMERLSDFWSDRTCKGGAVYRLDISEDEIAKVKTEVLMDLQNGVQFDENFNLDDDTKMYCSEWIRNKLIHSTGDPSYFPVTNAGDFAYIAPDNLYLNTHAQLIYKFKD
jgi:hypothetical protein